MEKVNSAKLGYIRKAARDAQAYRACQYLQALSVAIEHKKADLGYPGQLAYDKECEDNAAGMLDSAIATFTDDPPIPLRQCVVDCDADQCITPSELDLLIELLAEDCVSMFGG